MHILLILIVLCMLFPVFGRLIGWMMSMFFWLIAVAVVVGLIAALSR
jgi:hypothetical protein